MPEMLWESADPEAELHRRFGFASARSAADWAVRLLADDYGVRARSVSRIVISAQNLMLWLSTETGDRLLVKVCRLAMVHEWLTVRGALGRWLAERGQPVAAPLLSHSGDHQLLRGEHSVGVQPILPGSLLDADDLEQVRAAGTVLADLHLTMADWPDAELLDQALPVAQDRTLWAYPQGHRETVPADLQERLEQRIVDLPDVEEQPVHADFRGANVLSRNAQITGVLDFEEARIGAAVVDLAHAVCLLGTWYHDWQPISPEAQRAFLDSYCRRRPLTAAEQQWLPPLVGWRMLGQGWWDDARRWLD